MKKSKFWIIFVLAFFLIILFFNWVISLSPYIITSYSSKSMAPAIKEGDIVLIRENVDYITEGDIILYESEKPYLTLHRVIEKKDVNGNLYYETKGDNNRNPIVDYELDETNVSTTQIRGKFVKVLNPIYLLLILIVAISTSFLIAKKFTHEK